MSRAPGKLVLHHRSQGAIVGTLDAFFVMRAFGDLLPEDIKATVECAPIVKAFRPEGTASIVVIDPTSGFPSEETRRVAVEVSRDTNAQTQGLAIVVLGDGFWASAIRGVVTTIMSLSPSNHPRKVFRKEEEAVAWSIEVLGESSLYHAVLVSALQQMKLVTAAPPSIDPPSNSTPSGAGSKVPPSSKRRAG